ncbi:S1 family peptidase [Paraliomyxa miuraensis]|uniref:S1 family peptidase n=1 Tax=Paraliomyxa miuraensis TaxID=376150 RepID=UPI00225AC3C4|nr:trypsin-like serine protease [Paraliomyxa miuraensis]MCX4247648.1 S1 family peptidase [Paraliomyxa miuraensis]
MRRLALALPLIAFAPAAHAERLTTAPLPPQPIVGGAPVEACGWPTTVHLDGCTGTLVHPELVVFAAHCMFFAGGQGPATADFGETVDTLARQVPTAGCTMFPGWVPDETQFGNDVAFCTLAEAVTDVPIVPVLMGCETDVLMPDQEITLVGFGLDDTFSFGTKNEVVTTINGFEGPEINVGGNGTSSCNGDSGGPAYVQLPDGSWRVFGITSRGTSASCDDPSIYGLIHSHVEWIETESGLDITPCHDSADGTWNPGEDCGGFPLTPGIGETSWDQGCGALRLSGPSATCGDPFMEDTGSTGQADTGLDESGGSSSDGGSTDTGLPGGTASGSTGPLEGTTGDATTGNTAPEDDPDTVITCSCSTDAPVPRPLALLLLLFLPAIRRR